MPCADTIIVTGAGSPEINGTYVRTPGTIFFPKQEDPTYQLFLSEPFPGGESFIPFVWRFSRNPYDGFAWYRFEQYNFTGCPEDIPRDSWLVANYGVLPKPVLTSQGDMGFEFDPFAPWATLTETGRTRFLRLKVLGYI